LEPRKYTDVFIRKTIYIENNLLEMLLDLSASRKGEQTRIINEAISSYIKSQNPPRYVRPDKEDLTRKTVYFEKQLLDDYTEYVEATGLEQMEIVHSALSIYLSNPNNIEKHLSVKDWWKKPFWKKIHIHPNK
jgi:hypothetical protein